MLPSINKNGTIVKTLTTTSSDPAITTAEFWAGSHPDHPRYVLIFDLNCPLHLSILNWKAAVFLLKSKDNCIQICR